MYDASAVVASVSDVLLGGADGDLSECVSAVYVEYEGSDAVVSWLV